MRLCYGYYGPDRRKRKRIAPINRPIEARLLVGDREINAVMLDLSESGMRVLTKYNIPAKTLLLIKLILTPKYADKYKRMKPIEIKGEVRSNVFARKNKHYLGISFIDISPEDKQAITNFVHRTIKIVKIMAVIALVIILASILIPIIAGIFLF